MNEQQLQELISQIPPDVLLVVIQVIIEARPVVEAMLQASPEELQQAAQAIASQMQGGGGAPQGAGPSPEQMQGAGPSPEQMQAAGQQSLYGA